MNDEQKKDADSAEQTPIEVSDSTNQKDKSSRQLPAMPEDDVKALALASGQQYKEPSQSIKPLDIERIGSLDSKIPVDKDSALSEDQKAALIKRLETEPKLASLMRPEVNDQLGSSSSQPTTLEDEDWVDVAKELDDQTTPDKAKGKLEPTNYPKNVDQLYAIAPQNLKKLPTDWDKHITETQLKHISDELMGRLGRNGVTFSARLEAKLSDPQKAALAAGRGEKPTASNTPSHEVQDGVKPTTTGGIKR